MCDFAQAATLGEVYGLPADQALYRSAEGRLNANALLPVQDRAEQDAGGKGRRGSEDQGQPGAGCCQKHQTLLTPSVRAAWRRPRRPPDQGVLTTPKLLANPGAFSD